jgi:hypothetical protein
MHNSRLSPTPHWRWLIRIHPDSMATPHMPRADGRRTMPRAFIANPWEDRRSAVEAGVPSQRRQPSRAQWPLPSQQIA